MEHDTWMPAWLEIIVRSVAGFLEHTTLYGGGWILLYFSYETKLPRFFVIGVGLLFIGLILEVNPVRKMMEAESHE